MHLPRILPARIVSILALALLLGGPAAAQERAPEDTLRFVAGGADVAVTPCPPTGRDAAEGPVVICGKYHYDFEQFRVDLDAALENLEPYGEWSVEEGTWTRTFLGAERPLAGLYHVGFRNGAVMLTWYPRTS